MIRAKKAYPEHTINSMRVLLRAEEEGEKLFVTEFIELMDISSATFYITVREALIAYGFAEIETNPRERVVTLNLPKRIEGLPDALRSSG
ncbi:MAG: hypothetical protein QXV28_09290 [Ignisphaera sp.]